MYPFVFFISCFPCLNIFPTNIFLLCFFYIYFILDTLLNLHNLYVLMCFQNFLRVKNIKNLQSLKQNGFSSANSSPYPILLFTRFLLAENTVVLNPFCIHILATELYKLGNFSKTADTRVQVGCELGWRRWFKFVGYANYSQFPSLERNLIIEVGLSAFAFLKLLDINPFREQRLP